MVSRMTALMFAVIVFTPVKTQAVGLSDVFDFFSIGSVAEAVTIADSTTNFPVANNREPIRTLKVIATAYSSDPAQTDDTPCIGAMPRYNLCDAFITNGTEDTIAANFLPLGTKVRFPELYGDKIFTVRDRMNSRYNYENIGYYRIDFYKIEADDNGGVDKVVSKKEAIDFGVKRNLKMEVIGA